MPQSDPAVYVTLETPDGPFTLIAGAQGVLASGWTPDVDYLLPLIHATLRPALDEVQPLEAVDAAVTVTEGAAARSGSAAHIARKAAAAVTAYYAGDISAPDAVPVVQASGPYRMRAWEVLREVHAGELLTYTEYAARSGNPDAARAAASACAKNAAALFVPCHRVARSDGTLGGFRYGLPIKERLLAREGAVLSSGGGSSPAPLF